MSYYRRCFWRDSGKSRADCDRDAKCGSSDQALGRGQATDEVTVLFTICKEEP